MKLNLSDKLETLEKSGFIPVVENDITGKPVPFEDRIILGVFEGCFFVPDGKSRNGRYYPLSFWLDVLQKEDVRYRLNNGLMFGMIGHHDEPVSDKDLNDGKVSHLVVNLWIDESTGRGMGRAVILNTPAGRNLYTYFMAGSKLKVSSRAAGNYVEGKSFEGLPVVDQEGYYLDTFDVVKEPGFMEAEPSLISPVPQTSHLSNTEQDKNKQEHYSVKRGEQMLTEERVSQLISEAIKGVSGSGVKPENISEQAKILSENTTLKKEVEALKEQVKFLEGFDSVSLAIVKQLSENKKSSLIKEWSEIGEPEKILSAIDKMEAHSEVYNKYLNIDTPEKIEEALALLGEQMPFINKLQENGVKTPEQIDKLFEITEELAKFMETYGNLEQVGKAIEQSSKLLEEVEIKEARQKQRIIESKSLELSKQFNVGIETVKTHLKKMGEKETVKFFSKLAEDKETPNNHVGNPVNEGSKKPSVPSGKKSELQSLTGNINEGRPDYSGSKVRSAWASMYVESGSNNKSKGGVK